MKRLILALACVLAFGIPASGQPAPDRAAGVAAVVGSHAPAVETAGDEARRALLFDIVRALDGPVHTINDVTVGGDCCWGVLVKTDQANRIPADVIVWRPTLEHFDVLTGGVARAVWQPAGVVPSSHWLWQAVPAVEPPPTPTPTPEPTPSPGGSCDLSTLQTKLDQCLAKIDAVQIAVDQHAEEFRAAKSMVSKILTDPKTWVAIGSILSTWLVMRQTQDNKTPAATVPGT